MPTIHGVHFPTCDLPWDFCLYCKRSGHEYNTCEKLDKLACFSCEQRDHFRGECDEQIRIGNPRFDKLPTTPEEAKVQQLAWQNRCEIMFQMIRDHGLEEFASDLRNTCPGTDNTTTTLEEGIVLRGAWKQHCVSVFSTIKKNGFEAELDPHVRYDVDPFSLYIEMYAQSALSEIPSHCGELPEDELAFMRRIHNHIEALGRMQGESLYWRYTLALQMTKALGYFMANLEYNFTPLEKTKLEQAALVLDGQLERIFKEGLKKKGGLPFDQAWITLHANEKSHDRSRPPQDTRTAAKQHFFKSKPDPKPELLPPRLSKYAQVAYRTFRIINTSIGESRILFQCDSGKALVNWADGSRNSTIMERGAALGAGVA
ncbi:hypothetical protein EJ02DRAFT_432874 [Clathrospora elynae]|uniref:CCHC-type domain-containing protein n=1 Tax=Clathrospora elynae TaxID=706981 RepID=A0A6A5STJ0_9PLEO|nr:hypothetical protein EJ02DRAFT_432874 [Clathrospora elynae]